MTPEALELSERLRLAHGRVRALDAPPELRERVARRLLALTDVSKTDLPRAARRLEAFLADLDAGRLPED